MEKLEQIQTRITEEQKRHLQANFGEVSKGIRYLIDRDLERLSKTTLELAVQEEVIKNAVEKAVEIVKHEPELERKLELARIWAGIVNRKGGTLTVDNLLVRAGVELKKEGAV